MQISTITATCKLLYPVDIIWLAKYLDIDDVIIGLKLVYSGNQRICRGAMKISTKKQDFLNQCSIALNIGTKDVPKIVSVKIFHTGVVHITGFNKLETAINAVNILKNIISKVTGNVMIKLSGCQEILLGHDNIIYNEFGHIIGFKHGKTSNLFVKNYQQDKVQFEHVVLVRIENTLYFESIVWNLDTKNVYDLNGNLLGTKRINFDVYRPPKRHYDVIENMVFYHKKIIGKLEMDFQVLPSPTYKYYLDNQLIFCNYNAYDVDTKKYTERDLNVHLMNGFFQTPFFKISKIRLHNLFVEQGFYSRFDENESVAVNLRFHYNEKKDGICPNQNKATCFCKDISVLCFSSGKVNVTGMTTYEHRDVIYDFITKFFTNNVEEIKLV